MILKIYAESYYLNKNKHIDMLCWLWGLTSFEQDPTKEPQSGRYNKLIEIGGHLFELASLEEADVVVLPMEWSSAREGRNKALVQELAEKSAQRGKNVLVFTGSMLSPNVWIKNSIIFGRNLNQFERKPNMFGLPYFIEDLLEKNCQGELIIRKKMEKPTIGFCGYAPPLGFSLGRHKIKESIRLMANELNLHRIFPQFISTASVGHAYRAKCIKSLLRSSMMSKLNTNFIFRDKFSFGGSWGGLVPGGDVNRVHEARKEYVENLIMSDYILCVRGYENFSLRLYETLCCGRIPVFVDTDCVLPYDFTLNWKDFCVWIKEDEIPILANKIMDFHNKISDQEFIDFQYQCRRVWKDWLSPEGFFSNFYKHFTPSGCNHFKV